MSRVVETTSGHDVLHPGVRTVLVGVGFVRTWGFSESGRELWTLSCCARGTGAHGGQGWSAGPASQNDSLACCARMHGQALLLPAVLTAVATMPNVMLGARAPSPAQLGAWHPLHFCNRPSRSRAPAAYGEEPGWRGYAFPRLQHGRSALFASLTSGV